VQVALVVVATVDLAAGNCLVRHGKVDKDRAVLIPAQLAAEVVAWLAGRTGAVLPRAGGGPECSQAGRNGVC